jgi:hypothetical protein
MRISVLLVSIWLLAAGCNDDCKPQPFEKSFVHDAGTPPMEPNGQVTLSWCEQNCGEPPPVLIKECRVPEPGRLQCTVLPPCE